MAKKNISRFVLLGLLDSRPMSGYDIKKVVEFSIRDFWSESYGNIYPTLQKLLNDGLVEKTIEKQEGKPDRIVYTITRTGQNELTQWLDEPYEPRRIRDQFLAKFLFGYLLPIENNIHLLESYQKKLEDGMEWYRESVANLGRQGLKDRKILLEYLAISQGIYVREAKIQWCKDALKTIQQFQNNKKE